MFGVSNYDEYKSAILAYSNESCCAFDEPTAVRVILHVYSTCEKCNIYDCNVITNAIILAYDDSVNMAIPEGVNPDLIVYKRATQYLYTQTKSDSFIARNAKP